MNLIKFILTNCSKNTVMVGYFNAVMKQVIKVRTLFNNTSQKGIFADNLEDPRNLEPITKSAFSISLTSFSMSCGLKFRPASIITITSPFACFNPVRRAFPYPKFLSCLITFAPARSATLAVSSAEPSSTTIISQFSFGESVF